MVSRKNVKNEAPYHCARGFVPERIVSIRLDDDNRVCKTARFVNGFVAVRIERVERVEAAAVTFINGSGHEGIKHMHGLPKPRAVFVPPATPGGGHRRIFAFWVAHNGRPRPETKIIDDDADTLPATGAAYKANMAVVTIADGGIVFGTAKPEFALCVRILSRYSLRCFPLGAG